MKVSLSVLSVDYSNVLDEILPIINDVDYIHMDVMDGVFVPNISFGPGFIKSLRPHTKTLFDTHLMIENPINYIEAFSNAGSDLITFHVESKSNVYDTIKLIKSFGKKVGISIKPSTNVEEIYKYLTDVDLVLVMSVEPGFGGQKFMDQSLIKIEKLKEYRNKYKLNYLISVDGGINNITGKKVFDNGVDFAVVGSYILNKKDVRKNLETIKNII